MKRLVIALGALTLLVAAPAAADNTRWSWSVAAAENALVDSTLTWSDGEGGTIEDVVGDAACVGQGPSTRRSPSGPRLYKHFRCLVETIDQYGEEDLYWIRFHVKDKWRYRVEFLSRP